MKRCKGRCLTLAISLGEEIGDDSRRKYCAICEIYFGLCIEVTRLLQQCFTLSIQEYESIKS
jgi:hypothetical protein